ncbi:hypothetical protein VNI00_006772 [Paramarasmius palmivorus]|uniref:MYND-type domain-containing protein n=1 Tax=Paramarasmius palmivorus TaxID=297713 RepID=A0AAW0DAH2_9AGAR
MPFVFSPNRIVKVTYVGHLCEGCGLTIYRHRKVCGRCEITSYCSLDCRDEDFDDHMQLCQAAPTFPEHCMSSLPDRLLHSARKFTNIYHARVAIAALHGLFRTLDRFPDLKTESADSFHDRFLTLSRQSMWVITLQEKDCVSRLETPTAKDVHYVANSGKLVPHLDFPRKEIKLQNFLINRNKNIYDPEGIIMMLGVYVNDKDGVGQADYSLSAPVPNIAALQHAFLAINPEGDLALTGM